jgi:GntR family transcriptional regulator, gluconate operon transcriptional repressor
MTHQAEYKERFELIHESLRDMILSGQLTPGSRVFESDLAERFDVSRGPVRVALRLLETDGLVTRHGRRGTFITPISRRDVDEIYSLRLVIETLAMERATSSQNETLVRKLEGHLEAMREALRENDYGSVVRSDVAFHSEVYVASDHDRLLTIWRSLESPLRLLMGLTSARGEHDYDTTVQGHVAVLAAVRRGSTKEATDAGRRHLEEGHAIARRYVDQVPASDTDE